CAGAALDRLRIDPRLSIVQLIAFTRAYITQLPAPLERYTGKQPIFDRFDVEIVIQRSLVRKVELKSGGYLFIDQTEAMTTGEINA
ncbi:ribonuclease E/G, partial [Erwinia amylovora]|uniref:ribonuclease E/G n=1 Tax=Erwinia amylovora TaxID=552 RepID=UPI00200AD6A9